jgi:Domain of unknown function (DUF1937)
MIYLASPYSHPDSTVREERFRVVCACCAKLTWEGHDVFSPIAHTHPIVLCRPELLTGFDIWQRYDEWFLQRCDEVWVLMLPGWTDSVGVTSEIEIARDLGKPIRYLKEDGEHHASL